MNERVGRLSDRLGPICQELSVPFLPIFPRLTGVEVWRDEARRGDGIHPNRVGYALICDTILHWRPWREWVAQ